MSYTKSVTLWCDVEEDEDCLIHSGSIPCSRVTQIRNDDQMAWGWVYRDGKDICPSCDEV